MKLYCLRFQAFIVMFQLYGKEERQISIKREAIILSSLQNPSVIRALIQTKSLHCFQQKPFPCEKHYGAHF
jgi:hypothetical protein